MALERPSTKRVRTRSDAASPHARTANDDPDVSPTELLELLGDDTTRDVLQLVTTEARGGRDVAEAASVSRATAYRHLNKLCDAGLVETRTVCDPDGHHREEYHAVLERASLSFDPDGLSATVSVESTERHGYGVGRGSVGDD